MERLKIKRGISSPEVDFDPSSGLLRISGESYPENSFEFYEPITKWVKSFLSETTLDITFKVELEYLNTSSTKCMIDLLDELEEAHKSGKSVKVEWYYDGENERARDTIEEFREDFSMPFLIRGRGE